MTGRSAVENTEVRLKTNVVPSPEENWYKLSTSVGKIGLLMDSAFHYYVRLSDIRRLLID